MSADTPRNPDADPPPRTDHERAAEPDRAQPAERAPSQLPADARRSPHPAQPLNRAEYNAARHAEPPIRSAHPGEGKPPAGEHHPDAQPAVTHYHADFKGHRTDLYTDGTRWVSGDLGQREAASEGRGELPDDSPTGEDLVESAGEESSRLEKMRREIFEDDDVMDVISDNTNAWHDMFTPPQVSSYEAVPLPGPHFSATQHTGMDVGTGATALFALGLAIDRVAKWGVQHFEKHPEGK